MNSHPYADIFPKLEGTQLQDLADDIKANGLLEKIWTYEGKILDGRNRYAACVLTGVEAELRPFKGTDSEALAFVVSANIRRRHLTVEQLALAAAKVATLRKGVTQKTSTKSNGKVADASQEASTQQAAAEQFGVSRSSVQRARKVVESGSPELQKAVESGQIGLTKAASVVDKPKAEQLRAAQAPDPADEEPEENEAERIESMQREYLASIEKVMGADDKLSAAHEELKRQAAEIATLKISRDHWQNKCATLTRRVQSLQNKCDRLEKGN